MDYIKLSDLLLPNITTTPEHYREFYPKRNLKPNAMVTRYAPSPTGFQHLGGVFAALISERLAHQSEGIFYLRVEDTDKKREVAGAIEDTTNTLRDFGILFDEGVVDSDNEKGTYGPYKQSDRISIYHAFVKSLIKKGLAYPCFCTEEALDNTRKTQQELKINTGYHGKWAIHRNSSLDEINSELSKGTPYVIRLRSPEESGRRVVCNDLIKGTISMPENDQDIVILKTNGIPTYHFAHAVDDYLMGTTHVIRGEEWLSSLPIHLQLFEMLGCTPPEYAHIPTIMKMDGTSKRKLSKRNDPEISVDFYKSQGYPFIAVTEYLVNLINSNFQEWRDTHEDEPCTNFNITLENMSKSGALFDILKLNDISKNVIATMDASTVYDLYLNWAKHYDTTIANELIENEDYSKKIFNIERENEKPRKDFVKWLDVKEHIEYFFDDLYKNSIKGSYNFPTHIPMDEVRRVLTSYIDVYDHSHDNDTWFATLKALALELGYAKNAKTYKKNPDLFIGQLSDVATIVRVAITNKTQTQDLHEVMQVMGENRVIERLSQNFI
ncbi:glutamate--tRNA ligase [Clostridium sp. CM028]|uniref:glutamate--tRNA ligase n=1 Tax=unclassified Clostridium TaxID=2614128 RepID=UPI001C0CE416|nr:MULTISPECIES: glutamate--tRNA ligase [unclassified Clostridium]MBU3091822.1 glutamate--tRNA ligase [Clostridium sp. CF011]MBW9145392.1 glutamate--tRNA ligase [Clostridium sp. CM027]MBW9148788.1 glutamate--tRNA ligase [Clostridium sp. CM028]UVE42530.1 glutamate--tRNA ligase [Clostridium sp. CM027]WAG68278.1 glutamate--tRNA ligase [Clostridium sp. CF011]